MQGPSFMIYPRDIIIYTQDLTAAELGEYMLETIRLLNTGQFEKMKNRIGVGRIFKGTQKRPHIPMEIKRKVLATGYCLKCGTTERLSIDHIVPFSKGGSDDIENLQCLCLICNIKKSNK
jgi:hypothetical protein